MAPRAEQLVQGARPQAHDGGERAPPQHDIGSYMYRARAVLQFIVIFIYDHMCTARGTTIHGHFHIRSRCVKPDLRTRDCTPGRQRSVRPAACVLVGWGAC